MCIPCTFLFVEDRLLGATLIVSLMRFKGWIMKKVWSAMFNMSLSVANAIFFWANTILVVAAVLVAVSTFAAIWSGMVRERFADERISINELQTATAVADAARANESAEKLRESNLTLQARADHERAERLKLEAKIAPRRLSEHQKQMLIAALQPLRDQKIEIVCNAANAESEKFALDFVSVFRSANWDVGGGTGLNQHLSTPAPVGIILIKGLPKDANEGDTIAADEPVMVLWNAMKKAGLQDEVRGEGDIKLPPNKIVLRIGGKLD